MPFMIPHYSNEPFVIVTDAHGESNCFPLSATHHGYVEQCEDESIEHVTGKYWCRLSAPGYMDCTDWSGPFNTLEEAKAEIESMWDVDSESGEELMQEA